MVGHLPAPGVKHGGEADAGCTEKARIARELFESAARGAKECSVGNALVASREGAELLWQREHEEEVGRFAPPLHAERWAHRARPAPDSEA